jgi:hypothetical protein
MPECVPFRSRVRRLSVSADGIRLERRDGSKTHLGKRSCWYIDQFSDVRPVTGDLLRTVRGTWRRTIWTANLQRRGASLGPSGANFRAGRSFAPPPQI